MRSYVLDFHDIDKTHILLAGGKGANLGEISKVEGILVPDGFCITTEAFQRILGKRRQFTNCSSSYRFSKWKSRAGSLN